MMTNQQVFDKTVGWLRWQGEKSLSEPVAPFKSAHCMYRNPKKLRCAVGIHIDDEDYDKAFEGKSLRMGLNSEDPIPNITAWVMSKGLPFPLLRRLQGIHDSAPIEDWEEGWRRVALEFSLVYTPPGTYSGISDEVEAWLKTKICQREGVEV